MKSDEDTGLNVWLASIFGLIMLIIAFLFLHNVDIKVQVNDKTYTVTK